MDHELVKLAKACRKAAELHERVRFAEEIVIRVGPRLSLFVTHRCPVGAVNDVVQETLIGIGKGAHKFRGTTDRKFLGWCYRIASHKLADHWRRVRARPTVSLDVEEVRRAVEATAADAPIKPGDRLDLEEAMNLLGKAKPPCVNYLSLYFILGLDFKELAKRFRSTKNAMRMQINRCLTLARKLVSETL